MNLIFNCFRVQRREEEGVNKSETIVDIIYCSHPQGSFTDKMPFPVWDINTRKAALQATPKLF